MASFRETILQNTQPDYWNKVDYTNIRYKSFPLSRHDKEYTEIQAEFIGKFGSQYTITEIARIQHPYAYASCQIRRKQLSVKNGTVIPSEVRKYYCLVDVNQVVEFLESNCDKRKASCAYTISPSGCVVMAKQIANASSYSERSSNGYPDYLIKYERSTENIERLLGNLHVR